MLKHCVMHQNNFFKYCMQWLQEYCFLHVGTFCDVSKQIFFWSIVCNDCKNTVFQMLGPSLINENKFSIEVTNAVIAGVLFSSSWDIWSDECSNIARLLFSTWWNIVWCIKTNFLLKYCMQWLQEYCLEVTNVVTNCY